MVTTLIQPKLGLRKKSDAALLDYANNIINQLTLNTASFPGIPLAGLKTNRDKYNVDLSKMKNGTPADTATKNNSRMVLENNLKSIANDCSEIANGVSAIFLLSGFEIKAEPSPSGTLPAPQKFTVKIGPMEGTLEAKFKSVKNAYSYEIFYGEDIANPDAWTKFKVTTAGRIMIGELQSGVRYSMRVRAVGTKGKKGEWTEIITCKTY